ncbi:MAG: sulfur carrier protein ThiS [Pseudomonadota bacterium]
MLLRLNGIEKTFSQQINTVSRLLLELGAKPRRVAVEINGEIIDPSLFDETPVHDRDRVEIVTFVGGG